MLSVANLLAVFRVLIFQQRLAELGSSVVTDMGYMFYEAQNFNGDISTWDA